uniref:Uncharacterized protein n=1 Tax=Tetradesmus obliquus TaxID=3088 RepID=A0A383WFJ0_TETOB
MASTLSSRTAFASRTAFVGRVQRSPRLVVRAFATDGGMEEMNKQIGKRIKEAAAQLSTMRVWHYNAAVGKYVKKAAEDAAAGKLKMKGAAKAK